MRDRPRSPKDIEAELTAAAARLALIATQIACNARMLPRDVANRDPIALARWIIAARQARFDHLDADLFHDPAWDILLEVYVAHASGTRAPLTRLTSATNIPATTILSWLRKLEARGLILRERGSDDLRRVYVGMSAEGAARMGAYLATVLFGAPDQDTERGS